MGDPGVTNGGLDGGDIPRLESMHRRSAHAHDLIGRGRLSRHDGPGGPQIVPELERAGEVVTEAVVPQRCHQHACTMDELLDLGVRYRAVEADVLSDVERVLGTDPPHGERQPLHRLNHLVHALERAKGAEDQHVLVGGGGLRNVDVRGVVADMRGQIKRVRGRPGLQRAAAVRDERIRHLEASRLNSHRLGIAVAALVLMSLEDDGVLPLSEAIDGGQEAPLIPGEHDPWGTAPPSLQASSKPQSGESGVTERGDLNVQGRQRLEPHLQPEVIRLLTAIGQHGHGVPALR